MRKLRNAIEERKYSQKEIEKMMQEIEENPYFQLFQKTGIPRCMTCGKKYKKVKPYLWKGNCEHIPKSLLLAVG